MELHIFNDNNRQIAVLLDDNMKNVKPVYAFLRFQQQRGRTLNTLKAEGNDLRTYWRFLETTGLTYSEATPTTILDFIDYLRRNGTDSAIALYRESARTGKTINRILSTINQFYKFCGIENAIKNPILSENINQFPGMYKGFLHHAKSDNKVKKSLFKVKESNRPIRLLTDDEIERFYGALTRRRDKLLFKTLYLTGARIQEVLDLQIDAIPIPDYKNPIGVLPQIKSKGKCRDLYMPMSLIAEIDDFVMEYRSQIDTDHSYIFVSEQPQNLGNQLTYRAIYEVFKRVQKQTGIYFNFHDLRHTFVSNLVSSGVDVSIVRILAGHEHITTTQVYTHLSDNFISQSLADYWSKSTLLGGLTDG